MAVTYRFYVTVTDGDGLTRATAFRSRLTQYITENGQQTFWDWSNRARARRFCLAWCDSTLHTTIAADAGIVAISPELATVQDVQTWLDGLVGTLPAGIVTGLENGGIPVDWITGTTTRRQLWRFIAAWHFMVQRFSGSRDNALGFLARNLDNTVGQVSANARTRMSEWMQSRNLDTSWITINTTVRAVVKFIINNSDFPIMNHGPVNF